MSHKDTSKRHLSSASSPAKHDEMKGKVFITSNRYNSLSVEPALHQGLDAGTLVTVHINSNRSLPMFIKKT